MAKFAAAFQDEVRRLARKEAKSVAGPAARAAAQHRREIAQLKRQLRALEQKLRVLGVQPHVPSENGATADENGGARFSARSVKAQRRRTGLSAAAYAQLVGVSPLTVYHWENGKTRPRKEQLASLVALRGLGKRQALAKLAQVRGAKPPVRGAKPSRVRRRRG